MRGAPVPRRAPEKVSSHKKEAYCKDEDDDEKENHQEADNGDHDHQEVDDEDHSNGDEDEEDDSDQDYEDDNDTISWFNFSG